MMGSITRSGSEIFRRYLIHGARAILMHAKENDPDPNKRWALRLKDKIGMNKATVALAHRLARLIWCILKEDRKYSPKPPLAKAKKRILEVQDVKGAA
jgi:transposase